MNPETGHIKHFNSEEEARREGFTLPLSPRHYEQVHNRTLKGRKRYFRKALQDAIRREKQRLNRRLTPDEIVALQSKVLSV